MGGAVGFASVENGVGLLGGVVGSGAIAKPAIWHSVDGHNWEGPAVLALPSGASGVTIAGVAWGKAGWVAVGSSGEGGHPSFARHSSDGATWSLAAAAPVGPADNGPDMHLIGVASVADHYVALESITDASTPIEQHHLVNPRYWVSTDGERWTRENKVSLAVDDLTTIGGRAVTLNGPSALLVSTDGNRWDQIPIVDPTHPQEIGTIGHDLHLADHGGRVLVWGRQGAQLQLLQSPPISDVTSKSRAVPWERVVLPEDLAKVDPNYDPLVADRPLVAASSDAIIVSQPTRHEQRFWLRGATGDWAKLDVSRIPKPRRDATEDVRGLAVHGQVTVAVGARLRRDSPTGGSGVEDGGRIWFSRDRIGWRRANVEADITSVESVTEMGNGFVAVGYALTQSIYIQPLVLTSSDGEHWNRVDQPITEPGTPGSFRPRSIVASGTNLILAGTAVGIGKPLASLWTSSDATKWAPIATGPSAESWRGLCVNGDRVVAVGSGRTRPVAPALWTSTSAGTWTPITAPTDPSFAGFLPVGCAVDPKGRIAVLGVDGQTGAGEVRILAPDGRSWSKALVDEAASSRTTPVVRSILWTGSMFFVLGNVDDSNVSGDAVVWSSTDGTSWARVDAVGAPLRGPGAGDLRIGLVDGADILLGGTHGDGGVIMTGPATG